MSEVKWTDEELLKLDPELEQIFKKHGVPRLPLPTRDNLAVFRKRYSAVAKRYNESAFAKAVLGSAYEAPDWTEQDHKVQVRDGSSIKVRTYTPVNVPREGASCIVFIHGGGWYMGDLETEALLCRAFCTFTKSCVINVDYRLYPEVAFGVPVTDCYDAVKWVAANANMFGGNPRRGFVVGGNSGGGTYASIAVHLGRDENLSPPITGCILSCPILDDRVKGANKEALFDRETENRSIWQNIDAPLMNQAVRDSITNFADFDWNSKLLTPFKFADHANIPATFVQVCGIDPWRDVGILYERELRRAGCSTKLKVYPGLLHCWWTTYPQLKATQTWLKDTLEGVQWLLCLSDQASTKL